jgi:5-methyltetrahydropteroyltriglutamate--homocysteine methyltransferase
MSDMKIEPLATTTVGSFPRPSWLAQTQRGRATFRYEGEALREAQDDATIVCLREQEELGLDVLTDGEQRRESFVYYAARTWDGVDHVNQTLKTQYRGRDNYPHMVPRIVGKIVRRAPAMVEDVVFAKKHTKKPVKIAVAGPVTIIDSTFDEFYRDEAALAMDAAVAVNQELRDLQAAGCDFLQIDEPAMTRYHDKVFAYGADALDRCLEGITVPTIVHLCFGYPGGRSLQHQYAYPELLARLARTRIGGFNVEFGRSDFDVSSLKACGDRLVMFGCVDPGDSPAPNKEKLKERLSQALRVLDPRQILVAPDCGLMTISRSLARAKVAVMVAAARELRDKL